MRHVSADPPAFFHRGPSPLARLAFFGLISFALLFADSRYRYLENLREVGATVIYPLQRAAEGGHAECERVLGEALFADSGANRGQTPTPGNVPNENN